MAAMRAQAAAIARWGVVPKTDRYGELKKIRQPVLVVNGHKRDDANKTQWWVPDRHRFVGLALGRIHQQYKCRANFLRLLCLRLTIGEERRLIAGSFSRRMFWAWPPCLRASAASVDGFRLKHGNI
jgi:hypothetical protein